MGCPTPAPVDGGGPDAGADAGLDAGPDAGRRRDAGPITPPRPDAGCPPVDEGALGLFDFEGTFAAGSVVADEAGGAWVAGRELTSGGVRALALRAPTDVRLARALDLSSVDAVGSALAPGGDVWLAFREDGGSVVLLRLDVDGEVELARRVEVDEEGSVFVGIPRLAADGQGPVLALGIASSSTAPLAVHVIAFDPEGALRYERRLESGGLTVPTAIATRDGEVLVVTRSDAFTGRVVTVGGTDRGASAPWILSFDTAGELVFQIAIDAPIGDDLSLDVATRDGDWVLAGGTDPAFEMPWVVHLTPAGTVRAATLLDDVPSNRIVALRPTNDALRLFQAGPQHVAVSRSGQDPGTVQRALYRGRSASFALGPLGAWVAGPPPRCGRGTPEHPRLCFGVPPDALVWRLPGDRLTPCTEGMAATPWTEQDNEFILLAAVPTDRESRAIAAQVEAIDAVASELEVQVQPICLGPALCVR